jgi:hypothetical protein
LTDLVAFALPLCGLVWWAARLARSRSAAEADLRARSWRLRRRREETARLAIEVERTRLAATLDAAARARVREVVALAQAGAAGHPDARALFERIERQGRASLNEMRGLLGVLRSDERAGRSPRPTLAELETLVAEARAELAVAGDRRALPAGVELAAYRAVQHALVAVAGPATIELRYLEAALELAVHGGTRADGSADAALAAARERVLAHGGRLRVTTPRPGRRSLHAWLPDA